MKRTVLAATMAYICLAPPTWGNDGNVLLPTGCSLVCAESFQRNTYKVSGGGVPSSEQFQAGVQKIQQRAESENVSDAAKAQALKYLSAGIEGAGTPLDSLVSQALEDRAEFFGNRFDEAVAYSVAMHVDREVARALKSGAAIDVVRAKAISDAINAPDFWLHLPPATREALAPVQNKITTEFLSEILTRGIKSGELLARLGESVDQNAELTKSVYSAVLSAESGVRGIAKLAELQATELQKMRSDQSKWMNLASQQMSPEVQLSMLSAGIIQRPQTEIQRLQRQADANAIQADMNGISSAIGGVALGLSALGMDKEAAAMNQVGDLVGAAGMLAIGYTTMNPMVMMQGGFAAIGALSSFGRKPKESAESKLMKEVLKQIVQLRKEMAEYHQAQMQALAAISQQIQSGQFSLLDNLDEISFRLKIVEELLGSIALAPVANCKSLFDGMQATALVGTSDVVKADLGQLSAWMKAYGSQMYGTCNTGLQSLLVPPSAGTLWPHFHPVLVEAPITSIEALDLSGNNLGDERAAGLSVFVYRTLDPIAQYAGRYLEVDPARWKSGLTSFDFTIGGVEESFSFKNKAAAPGVFALPSNYKQLLPAGLNMISVTKVDHLGELVAQFAKLSSVTVPKSGVSEVISPDGVRDCVTSNCIELYAANESSGLMIDKAVVVVEAAIGQEILLSGAPILVGIVDTLEEVVIPAYREERRFEGKKLLSDMLVGTIPQPEGSSADGTWKDVSDSAVLRRASTCTTGNRVFDTLCLVQTNPWLAENAIKLLVYRRARALGESSESYLQALRGQDVNKVRRWVGSDVALNDSLRRGLPQEDRSVTWTWGMEIPRIDVPSYYRSSIPKSKLGMRPQNCWAAVGSDRFPALSSYISDATWAKCLALPSSVEGSASLAFRSMREEASPGQGAYVDLLQSARRDLKELRWALGDPSKKLSDYLVRIAGLRAATSAHEAAGQDGVTAP